MKTYVDKDKLQEFATKLHNKQKTIFAPIEAVGSPLVASTVAGMTDENKVYVYTGSETGYTSGNWYYYNGSAWISGGVYNSAGFVLDDTLTNAAKPAQAKAVGDAIEELDEYINGMIDDTMYYSKSQNLFDGVIYEGYITKDGTLVTTKYKHTNKIDVHSLIGETIKVYNDGSQSYIRFVCIYDKNNNAISSLGTNDNALTFTIPEGAYYAVLSFASASVNTNYVLITTGNGTVYLPYKSKWTVKGYDSVQGAIDINEPIALRAATLANGERLTANAANGVKRLGTYYFYCKLGTLTDDAYIIVGKDSSKGYAVGISASKWAWFVNDVYQGGGNHGLTIKDYLMIVVDKVPGTGAVLTIYTNGGTYTRTNTSWMDNHGTPYVFNNSGVDITDVKMTWTSSAFRNRNWLFGDSYVSNAATRWPKYVYDLGFGDNLLINGYPGEQSAAGYKDFLACLDYGIPSVAAWCLGMNDADNGSINSSWMNHVQAFLEVCEMYDITPILATIPCCPIANHSYKNAWIRSSGYRYIDFANAVNVTLDSTTWFDGMLADDNIHPTEQGAIALASQVLADYPELMIK